MLTVVAPIDDTPAQRAGIKSGDQILKIDDESTHNMELARAMLPMYVILLVGVLLITYWPWLTTGVLALFGRS